MKIRERAAAYRAAFPQYPDSWPVVETGRWMNATWMPGGNWRGSGYYGAYPPWYLPRMAPMFDERPVMHLFSGSLPPGDYVRVDSQGSPDLLADAEDLSGFKSFGMIYADPPYSQGRAEHYGTLMINRRRVLQQCWNVLNPGGILAWMDVMLPMYSGKKWIHWGNIHLIRSTNHWVRLVSLFKKVPTS